MVTPNTSIRFPAPTGTHKFYQWQVKPNLLSIHPNKEKFNQLNQQYNTPMRFYTINEAPSLQNNQISKGKGNRTHGIIIICHPQRSVNTNIL